MRLGDAHLQVFGQTSDDQFLGCIHVTPKYKTCKKKRDSLVQRKVRGTGRGCSVSDLCRPWPLPSTVAGTW